MLLTKPRSFTSIERAAKLKQCTDLKPCPEYGWVNRLATGKRDTIEELRSMMHKEELDMSSQAAARKRPKLVETKSLGNLITGEHVEEGREVQDTAEEEELEMAEATAVHSRYDFNQLVKTAVDEATTMKEEPAATTNASYGATLDLAELLRGRDVQAHNLKAYTPHQSFSHPFIS